MNRYGITINGKAEQIEHASSTHTAVNNAMRRWSDSHFKPYATIKVRFISKIARTWDVIGDAPFEYPVGPNDNAIGYRRQTLAEGLQTKAEADKRMQELSTSNMGYKNLRLRSTAILATGLGKV